MSHGDEITKLPEGFDVIGSTKHVPFAFSFDEKRKIIGILFHPEVEHTEYGDEILQNFLDYCGVIPENIELDIKEIVANIKQIVADSYVIGAVSGGVDSTVAGALVAKAIGRHFLPIYVDNGLMREENRVHVQRVFAHFGVKANIIECENEMLTKLEGISDPEEKRRIIGAFYIQIFEREMRRLLQEGKDVRYLMQGTIYSDVIESKGTKHADKIKSHHNVAGLPEVMALKLLEPLREFYKDEVRQIGIALGLPEDFIWQQPFPGPGYGIRIRGEVTKERLEKEKQADRILLEELKHAGLLEKVFMSFPIMTGTDSVAVKGDGRFFGEVIALRIVESRDVMTAIWSRVPYDVLQRISSRIVNEVPGISRVVYDISTKPPATMEWE
jgi:GMP synthase (glutamine-hydrolysing)